MLELKTMSKAKSLKKYKSIVLTRTQKNRITFFGQVFFITFFLITNFCFSMSKPVELAPKNNDNKQIKKDIEKIGFNIAYFDKIPLASWQHLLEAYSNVPESKVTGELVQEDIAFFKVYSQIFSDEYYSRGTISSYVNYEFKQEFLTLE